jgi:hypothetical protein
MCTVEIQKSVYLNSGACTFSGTSTITKYVLSSLKIITTVRYYDSWWARIVVYTYIYIYIYYIIYLLWRKHFNDCKIVFKSNSFVVTFEFIAERLRMLFRIADLMKHFKHAFNIILWLLAGQLAMKFIKNRYS